MNARDLERVERKAAELKRASAALDRRREDLIAAVEYAYDEGASEVALARAAGVARTTIRAWLGK